jgi:hypothetical protein
MVCQPLGIVGNVGMGNAGSNYYAKNVGTAYAIGMLAWVLLQECSPYWHGMCYQQLPCQKKSSIRVHFVLDMTTKIWYNRGLDFWKWGACAEKSFPKFYKNRTIGFFQNIGGGGCFKITQS